MRIGHISDIHLRHSLPGSSSLPARRSREGPALLEAALRAMRRDGVALVAVTGDIVDIPGPESSDDEALSAAVVADYVLCRDILMAGEIPYIVVPGNHDDYAVVQRVFSAGTGFREFGGLRFVSFWDREHDEHVPRRVDAESNLLDEMLNHDDHLQVHLQHFVLTQVPSTDYPYTYENRDAIVRRIVDSGRVRLSLSGHYHAGTELIQIGSTYFSTAPALTEYPHRYRAYDVGDTSVTMQEYSALTGGSRRRASDYEGSQ